MPIATAPSIIPHAVARDVVAAAELCGRREEPILAAARSADFSIDKLEQALAAAPTKSTRMVGRCDAKLIDLRSGCSLNVPQDRW